MSQKPTTTKDPSHPIPLSAVSSTRATLAAEEAEHHHTQLKAAARADAKTKTTTWADNVPTEDCPTFHSRGQAFYEWDAAFHPILKKRAPGFDTSSPPSTDDVLAVN